MDYTLAEAQALLTKVNIAIESKITNTRYASFKIGSTDFNRTVEFDITTLQELLDLRKSLLDIITALQPEELPTFRKNAIIGIVARKGDL